MAPNSPACSLIQASMAGARSTAPLNRSNSVLIVATLESAGVFSHGVLRGTCWFQGATLSSYSMGSPKPTVWTPSWRRASKAINRRCALNVMIWAKTPPNVKVSAGSHRASTNVSSQAERFRMSLKIRCSSASVFSSLCDALCEPAETFTFGGVFAHIMTFNAHRRLMALDALRQLGVQTEGFGDPMEYEESVAPWNQQVPLKTP